MFLIAPRSGSRASERLKVLIIESVFFFFPPPSYGFIAGFLFLYFCLLLPDLGIFDTLLRAVRAAFRQTPSRSVCLRAPVRTCGNKDPLTIQMSVIGVDTKRTEG